MRVIALILSPITSPRDRVCCRLPNVVANSSSYSGMRLKLDRETVGYFTLFIVSFRRYVCYDKFSVHCVNNLVFH